jgi:hypothetical protein
VTNLQRTEGGTAPTPTTTASAGAPASDAGTTPPGQVAAAFTDGWAEVPWATGCNLYQPDSPTDWAAVSPLHWKACSSGRPGCQEINLDWADAQFADVETMSVNTTAAGTTVALTRMYGPYQREYLVWDVSSSAPVAAWRHNGPWNCVEVQEGDLSSGAYSLSEAVFSDTNNVSEYRTIVGQPAALLSKLRPDVVSTPAAIGVSTLDFASREEASNNLDVTEFAATNHLMIRDTSGGSNTLLGANDGGGVIQSPAYVVGSTVFYNRVSEIDVWTALGRERPLVQKPNVDAHDFSTDGTTMAWIESTTAVSASGFYANGTLFVSPYATAGGDVHATSLGDPGCRFYACGSRVSGGYFVTQSWNDPSALTHDLVVVRTSDGGNWRLNAINTTAILEQFGLPGFVSNGELWQSLSVNRTTSTVMRIQIAALGAAESD